MGQLLAQARAEFAVRGLDWPRDGAQLEAVAWDALSRAQEGGLLLFHSSHRLHTCHVPVAVPPEVNVDSRFTVRPLVTLLDRPGPFYTLVLDPDGLDLLQGSTWELGPVRNFALPKSIDELALPAASETQAHRMAGGMSSLSAARHYLRNSDSYLRRFLRFIDAKLRAILRAPKAALVVCAPTRLRELFLQTTVHRDVVVAALPLPDQRRPQGILAHVRGAVERRWAEQRYMTIDSLPDLRRAGQLRAGLPQVLPAADEGRVESLFIARGHRCWGRYDPSRRRLRQDAQKTPSNEELIDLAAIRTASQGGSVLFVEPERLPTTSPVLALMRY